METMEQDLTVKEQALRQILRQMGSAVIGLSGGVDSVLLAYVASQELGERALSVTADSPSLARRELQDTLDLARQYGWRHRVIQTDELSNPDYAANPANRCYFCKQVTLEQLDEIAAEASIEWVCLGENVDDQNDHRPGSQAAREHGVRAPLKEAGLTKADIRALAKTYGLPVWDKPAAACLSSRIPYGMPVTAEKLAQIEAAEDYLHSLGLRQCRVRHHGEVARIEVPAEDIPTLAAQAAAVDQRLRQIGFAYVALDLGGYRRGSLNEQLPFWQGSAAAGNPPGETFISTERIQ